MFTKTETYNRLTKLAKQARELECLPRNAPVEIGLRVCPVHLDQFPTNPRDLLSDDPEDDLDDFVPDTWTAAGMDEHKQEGAVVHLYLYSQNPHYGRELIDVYIGWLGTKDHEPVLR